MDWQCLQKFLLVKLNKAFFQVEINNSQPLKTILWKVIEMRLMRVHLGIYKVMQGWAYETKSGISDIQKRGEEKKPLCNYWHLGKLYMWHALLR